MWIEAGPSGCSAVGRAATPDADVLWRAVDQFHLGVMASIRDRMARDVGQETQRLVRRSDLTTAQTYESFERLSAIVVRRSDRAKIEADPSDPLLAACRMVAEANRSPFIGSCRSDKRASIPRPLAPLIQYVMLIAAIGVSFWIIIGGIVIEPPAALMEAINRSNARLLRLFGRPATA